jgi:hypothetical protein
MHASVLARCASFCAGFSDRKLQLSRSFRRRNLGPARTRSKRALLIVIAVASVQTIVLTVARRERPAAETPRAPANGRGGLAAWDDERFGPLGVTGALSVADTWERQQLSMARGTACPVRPRAPVFMVLTTIPSRAALLAPMISRLLRQTFPVDILLSVPDDYKRFPLEEAEAITRLARSPGVSGNPRVHVLRGKDVGPGTKLLFPLSRLYGVEADLIVIDDDQVYAPTLACDLLAVSSSYPQQAISRRSRVFPKKHCGNYFTSSLIAEETVHRGQARLFHGSDLVMGTSGYLVKSTFFGDSIFDYSACAPATRDAVFWNDDVWISGHLKRRQVDIVTSLSGFRSSATYTVGPPEISRQRSGSDGLWLSRASPQGALRSKALQAFFGAFCVPNQLTWRGKDSVCDFKLHST